MTFSILAWNIWFYNQIEGEVRAGRLLDELKRLVEQHEPDFIALNEVAQPSRNKSSSVVECLEPYGYRYNHRPTPARFNEDWLAGAAFCSRIKPKSTQNIILSEDGFAAQRGYPGYKKEAIGARITIAEDKVVKIIVAHPQALIDRQKEHYAAMNTLNQLVHSEEYANNTVLVGDMNEWRLIPGAFRAKISDVMYSRTGSMLHPTWRYNAHRFTPLRANLDYLYWSKDSDFCLETFKVLASNVSDHRPLLATFRYK